VESVKRKVEGDLLVVITIKSVKEKQKKFQLRIIRGVKVKQTSLFDFFTDRIGDSHPQDYFSRTQDSSKYHKT